MPLKNPSYDNKKSIFSYYQNKEKFSYFKKWKKYKIQFSQIFLCKNKNFCLFVFLLFSTYLPSLWVSKARFACLLLIGVSLPSFANIPSFAFPFLSRFP